MGGDGSRGLGLGDLGLSPKDAMPRILPTKLVILCKPEEAAPLTIIAKSRAYKERFGVPRSACAHAEISKPTTSPRWPHRT